MKKLLEFIVKSIVEKPEEAKINQSDEGEITLLKIKVHPEDKKVIIGKSGRTIKALRNLVRIKATKEKKRVNLELEEE